MATSSGAGIFIAKFDSSGNGLWGRGVQGTADASSDNICMDPGGNIIISGYFDSGTLIFGSDSLKSTIINVFVAKFNHSGIPQWGHQNTGDNFVQSKGIISDANSNYYMIGAFNSPNINFSGNVLNTQQSDFFLVKYDSSGSVQWVVNDGFHNNQLCGAIDIVKDQYDNVCLMGNFSDSLIFPNDTLLASKGSIFVITYNHSGNNIYERNFTQQGFTTATSLNIDSAYNIYMSGRFEDDYLVLDTITLINSSPPGEGYADALRT